MGPTDVDFDLASYLPLFIYLFLILGFAVTSLILAQVIGPWKKTPVKQMPYESGMDPFGDARRRFDIKYYLIAIMFVVFDVELLFLYPWIVASFGDSSWLPSSLQRPVFWCVLVFLGILVLAYVYDLLKGVFRWR